MTVNGQRVTVTEKPSKIKADPTAQVVAQNVQADKLPKNGQWEDETKPGNCMFIIDDNAQIKTSKGNDKQIITGKQLKEKYGIKGVQYVANEPDFTPFVDQYIGCVEVSEISTHRGKGSGTYSIAESAVAQKLGISEAEVKEYMKQKRLTWHESADRKRIMAIPSEINQGFGHTGGISKQKSVEAIRRDWKARFGDSRLVLQREEQKGRIASSGEFQTAIRKTKERYKQQKKQVK